MGCQSSCQQTSGELETRYGREGHTRPRGPSESPDGVDPNIRRTRKTQRDGHNSGVKIWSLCSVSSTLSHATLEQPFRTLAIKWEVNICKEVFLRLPSCVFIMRLYSCVCRLSCVCYHCVGMYPVYICMQQCIDLLACTCHKEKNRQFILKSAVSKIYINIDIWIDTSRYLPMTYH